MPGQLFHFSELNLLNKYWFLIFVFNIFPSRYPENLGVMNITCITLHNDAKVGRTPLLSVEVLGKLLTTKENIPSVQY